MRIHTKIVLFLLVGGLIPVLVMSAFSLILVEGSIRSARNQALLSLGTEVAKELQREVNAAYNSILLLAENPALGQDIRTRETIEKEFHRTLRFHPIVKDLTLLDQNGNVLASGRYSFRGTWKSTTWFQKAVAGESLLSDVHVLIYPRQTVMTVALAVPNRTDAPRNDILIGQIDMEPIWKIVSGVNFGDQDLSTLIDRRGLIVAGPKPDRILDPLPHPVLLDAIRTGTSGILPFRDDNQDMVASFVPVDQNESQVATGWTLIFTQPEKELYAAAFHLRHGLFLTSLIVLLAVILLGNLFSRRIIVRINALVMAARGLGQGDFHRIPTDNARDEIGELSRIIAGAGQQLAAADEKIRSYQAGLEQQVKDRTAELVEANWNLQREIEEHQRIERDRNRLEDQLRQSQKMEAVGTLAGGIAHDFNNILQAIAGNVQLLLMRRPENDRERESLMQIDRTVERATELVRRLLTFSRKMDVVRTTLNLNTVIVEAVKLLQRTIPKMIDIETNLAPNLFDIEANATQMEQVLMNLANNARDAMPDGGRLVIATETFDSDGRGHGNHPELAPGPYVVLRVSDSGLGIDDATREHIFEPFFTTKAVGQGTGLGLSTVYGIVTDHGGHITCSSEKNRGTTFSIYLPALPTVSTVDNVIGTRHDRQEIEGGTERILLVDDEELILELTEDILSGHGYTVLTASSGEEALKIFRLEKGNIDLVVTDLGMPGMGGEHLIREMKEIYPKARILVTSGYAAHSMAEDPHLFGASDFIRKPYRLDEMLLTVRHVLDEIRVSGHKE
ncbi:MAG: response regulator [Deltaproteobacteria bacterium]|nr:response regulator [Deltaproteobacteria bacterium]